MGMAASQARFLGLTARKTNCEYEGQQVNQQRTALSNQSAGLFNQMLTLTVPTPPSATDYYTMRYSFEQGGQNYEIINYTSGTEAGKYDVTVRTSYEISNYTDYEINKDASQVQQSLYKREDGGSTSYYMRFGTSTTEYALTGPAVNEALSTAKSLPLDTKYYLYNRDGTSYYMTQAEVENKATDDGYKGEMFAYRRDNSVKVEDKTYNNCTLIQDSTGKFQYITLPDGSQYTLSLEEVTDDVGYEAAMQQYNYDKMVYDKTIADINAQTEQIQAQDRTLELRLKQLDTEQEALQTEMDAVKKVIEKNVENTFKTFA